MTQYSSLTIEQLRIKRGSFKKQLTDLEKFLEENIVKELSPSLIINFKTRLTRLQTKFNEFDEVQSNIEILTDKIEDDSKIKSEIEDRYYNIVSVIQSLLDKKETVNLTVETNNPNKKQLVQLPTINLPSFDGEFTKWRSFQDAFNALINDNKSLSNVEKLYYLRSALKGEALNIIDSLETTADNYDVAINLITDRFSNNRKIIYSHVNEILTLKCLNLQSFINSLEQHTRSLKTLQVDVESWDAILLPIIVSKLDSRLVREWENRVHSKYTKNELPNYSSLIKFLMEKSDASESSKHLSSNHMQKGKLNTKTFISVSTNHENMNCLSCKSNHHKIYSCKEFLKKDIHNRLKFVKSAKLCLNCLKRGHFVNECKSSKCRECSESHNTLLHFNKNLNDQTIATNTENSNAVIVADCSTIINSQNQILLSTAEVIIYDKNHERHTARALLDSASQSNFMSKRLAETLQLDKHNTILNISGITQHNSNIRHCTLAKISSKCSNFKANLSFLIVDKITESLPQLSFDKSVLELPKNINLADNSFNTSQPVDILLGAQIFWEIIEHGKIKLDGTKLILQNSRLGWIVSGQISYNTSKKNISYSFLSLESQIERFWQIEEFKSISKQILTIDEIYCEDLFKKTTKRDQTGRFVVQVPLKPNYELLGNSKSGALKRFFMLENKLQKFPDIKQMYVDFMREYENLKHMSKVTQSESEIEYYIPHHPVIRESSSTTKLRVVFDASFKSDSGYSLNDIQYVGPTIQSDLFSILINFRKYTYIAIADIEKMYRQVLIPKHQRSLHKIFWRSDPSEILQVYELNTLTYGTASAPYLAIKTLQQLAIECKERYPNESYSIEKEFYVDDLITGSDNLSELNTRCSNITAILNTAKFNLRKWKSNSSQFNLLNTSQENSYFTLNKNDIKTLGLCYNPMSDAIQFSFKNRSLSSKTTKRTILSETAQIFDPLGLISPITIVPRILIQSLWSQKIDWDAEVPQSISQKWQQYKKELHIVDEIQIPRHIINPMAKRLELHGFADASERAYGACIYLKSIGADTAQVTLVTAKSRVAPLKNLSIPRLELCAAMLLAELMDRIGELLKQDVINKYYWSDSKIVLAWISGTPSRWKTFVANRVANIQRLSDNNSWYYVNTKENPADLISRGTNANELKNSDLWWVGPTWLSKQSCFEKLLINVDNLPDEKPVTVALKVIVDNSIFYKYSKLSKLVNVVAYCKRFLKHCNKELKEKSITLSKQERRSALMSLIKLAQIEVYQSEIHNLSNNKEVSHNSTILSLSPFIDNVGILRVGGRLNNAKLNFDQKHQMILPPKHVLTKLIITQLHVDNLHCGQQCLLNIVRQNYWPINGKSIIREIIHKCLTCYKTRPRIYTQQMGNLPADRVTPSYPFQFSGIDYAGPFLTRDRRIRGYKTYKAYICLFICLNTKAIHLELVSDMSTEAFLASLKRFIARRGKPDTIYSDNGTNFVGANSELKKFVEFIGENSDYTMNFLSNNGNCINWKFIPPRSPHFGGIWESHIKIVKSHLTKTIGERVLTFEEFYTLLTQIEAVVNSRPLSPLSNDPEDLCPLTPAHFLIGRPIQTFVEGDYTKLPENRLSVFQRMQQLMQHFWNRWHVEYIHHLQPRGKWQQRCKQPPSEGDLVLIVEENCAPFQWKLGRIVKLWPGKDGQVRVVSVRTATNVLKRALSKVCPLPIDN